MNLVHFAGNDYLGLARDPRLAVAACEAARHHGIGATSGRFFLGWSDLHKRLESEIAAFFGTEDACLLPSCYLGGLVFFKAMSDRLRTAFCDQYCHSNLLDGIRAAGLEVRPYRHLDPNDLKRQLAAYTGREALIVTDGVFGISGEIAPVREMAELAAEREFELLVDDAHGVFALGRSGRGVCELANVQYGRLTILGSMSKALGCHGGFFCGAKGVMERLQRASGGASPAALPIVAASLETIRIVRSEPQRREQMAANAGRMRMILAEKGIPVVAHLGPIIAAILTDEEEARNLAQHLESRGLVVRYAKYPSEPRHNLLRMAARACHTAEDLVRFEEAIGEWVARG
ncbi:MAG: aminotransferase class I/II-fold pyridoxal phosphate-dependent enzyme [Kiritimatiellia bacterium]